jgi:threonine 3-dehydrogenase
MKILVTGAAGQVGADLLPRLVAQGHRVTVGDLAPRPAGTPREVEWVRCDVGLAAEVNDAVRRSGAERIYHLAAILSARGEKVPHQTWRVNMEGTYNVLEAARVLGARQVFFTSTIAAFGPGLANPVANEVSMRPRTMYGVTKVAGELLGEYYEHAFGLDFRGVRFPGLLSATTPGGGTSDYALHMFVDGITKGAYESFVKPSSQIPFMYMPDAVRSMLELADAPKARLTRSIYNVAAMSPTAEEFADAVRKRVPGVRLTFRPDPERQRILDSWPRVLDDSAARADWGWRHEYDLDRLADDLVAKVRSLPSADAPHPVPA